MKDDSFRERKRDSSIITSARSRKCRYGTLFLDWKERERGRERSTRNGVDARHKSKESSVKKGKGLSMESVGLYCEV